MDNNEQSQHLEYFKVENFKGLESLELKEIQQFNLILGDNNIGKTSVLEALLFDEEPFMFLANLAFLVIKKGAVTKAGDDFYYFELFTNSAFNNAPINYSYRYIQSAAPISLTIESVRTNDITQKELDSLVKNTVVDLNQLPKKISRFEQNGVENYYTFNFNQHRVKNDSSWHVSFVKSGSMYLDDLVSYFSRTVNIDISLKKEFISNLHFFSPDIEDITIDTTTIPNNPILLVLFNDGKKPLPLFMMGDGTIRLVRLTLEIIASKGKRLMIDEIDNGMHFSKMKKVWEVVIRVAAKYNTQLFVTTHDAECLRAFKEVLESEELSHLQEKVASYTLFRNKENKVDAVKYDFRGFEHSIDNDLEVRN